LEEEHKDTPGFKGVVKDELYAKAEGLNITKNPFSGGTTQRGAYHYDGWSSMSKLLGGDPALVCKSHSSKHGGTVFKLTRSGGNLSGHVLAKALHGWCHEHGICDCHV